jgi:hypothetical protein
MLAARLSSFAQIQEHSWRSIDAVAGIERRMDELQQPCTVSCSLTLGLLQPGVVATGRHLEHPAHHPNVELVVCPHELINLSCSSRTELLGHRSPQRQVWRKIHVSTKSWEVQRDPFRTVASSRFQVLEPRFARTDLLDPLSIARDAGALLFQSPLQLLVMRLDHRRKTRKAALYRMRMTLRRRV